MTTNIVGVDGATILNNYTGPAAGEPVTASSVNTLGQGLANQIRRRFNLPSGPYALGAGWFVQTGVGTGVVSPANVVVPFDSTASIMLNDLPHEAVIDSFTVRIDPGAHGGSYPPAGFPTLGIYEVNATTGVGYAAPLYSVTDSPASQGAYEAAHDLVLSFADLTLDRITNLYYVVFTQENGANAVDGQIMGGRVNIAALGP